MVAYVTKDKSIELYDLEKEILIKTIKDTHLKDINSCRHFFDMKMNSDLIIISLYIKFGMLKKWIDLY